MGGRAAAATAVAATGAAVFTVATCAGLDGGAALVEPEFMSAATLSSDTLLADGETVAVTAGALIVDGAAVTGVDATGGGVTRTGVEASAADVSALCASNWVAERARTAAIAVMPRRSGGCLYLMRNQPGDSALGSADSGGTRVSCGESSKFVENPVTAAGRVRTRIASKRSMIMAWLRILGLGCVIALGATAAEAGEPAPPVPVAIDKGVWMIPGGIATDRQPDGNSLVLDAPGGLIVVDTGRHAWHRDIIVALAKAQGRPVAAIVNSHWHLDHVSGNPALRAAYPELRVYASTAIDGALAGFLPDSAREARPYLDDPKLPEATREDLRADMATIANGPALRPDVAITASGPRRIAGRRIAVHLAADAATAGDIWLYDGATHIVAAGDLVTLPAPFLDTACSEGWSKALAAIAATPFHILVPGHGAPMTPPQFALYRRSFDAFIACAGSSASKDSCAAAWAAGVAPLLDPDPVAEKRAKGMSAYYVAMLRANGGRSKYCHAPDHR